MTQTAAVELRENRVLATDGKSRAIEFLLVGGATLVLYPLGWCLRGVLGLSDAELLIGFLTFHAAHLINDPHFSVTYLLFYKDARRRALGDYWNTAQRIRYWIAAAVVPLLLAFWIGAALTSQSAPLLGALIQLMFLLVGWHYTKQGFGVLSVLAARRGIKFSSLERIVILLHCFAGWAYAWASPADPGTQVEEKGVVYTSLAHSAQLEQLTRYVFLASALALVTVLFRKWRREGRLPFAGLTGLLVSVWFWSVYSSVDPLMIYLIPALHSVQYLYFVWLMKRNEARAQEGPPAFGAPVRERLAVLGVSALALGFVLFHALPFALDTSLISRAAVRSGQAPLGPTPYFAAIFAFVNIHHYFMDAVLWRRENPDTRYLRAS